MPRREAREIQPAEGGFSLIETLVMIGICGIVAMLLFTTVASGERHNFAHARSNLAGIERQRVEALFRGSVRGADRLSGDSVRLRLDPANSDIPHCGLSGDPVEFMLVRTRSGTARLLCEGIEGRATLIDFGLGAARLAFSADGVHWQDHWEVPIRRVGDEPPPAPFVRLILPAAGSAAEPGWVERASGAS